MAQNTPERPYHKTHSVSLIAGQRQLEEWRSTPQYKQNQTPHDPFPAPPDSTYWDRARLAEQRIRPLEQKTRDKYKHALKEVERYWGTASASAPSGVSHTQANDTSSATGATSAAHVANTSNNHSGPGIGVITGIDNDLGSGGGQE